MDSPSSRALSFFLPHNLLSSSFRWTGVAIVVVVTASIEIGRAQGLVVPIPFLLLYSSLVFGLLLSRPHEGVICGMVAMVYLAWAAFIGFGPRTLIGGWLSLTMAYGLLVSTCAGLMWLKYQNALLMESLHQTHRQLERKVAWQNKSIKQVNEVLKQRLAMQQETEQALQEQEALWRGLVERNPEPIAISTSGRFAFVNPAGLHALGASSEDEILGRSITDFIDPAHHSQMLVRQAALLAGQATAPFEHKVRRLDGAERYFESFSIPVTYKGKPAAQSVIRDVTERRKNQERLERLADQMWMIHDIDRAALGRASPRSIAADTINQLRPLIPADRISILFEEEASDAFEILASWAEDVDDTLSTGDKVPYALLSKTLLSDVAFAYYRDLSEPTALEPLVEHFAQRGFRSLLQLPLIAEGQTVGSLNLSSYSRAAFSDEDVAFAMAVSGSLAIALQHVRLFTSVETTRTQLSQLTRCLVDAQEQERRWIALELHDEVGQTLTAIKFSLEGLEQGQQPQQQQSLSTAHRLIDRLTHQISDLSLELRPAMLDDLGLLPTMVWYIKRFEQTSSLTVDFQHTGLAQKRWSSDVETAAFRIVQEALTNASRHAGAGLVEVCLIASESHLHIRVEDQGEGFDPKPVLEGSFTGGISGMRQRAQLLDGQFSLSASPGRGTLIEVSLPVPAKTLVAAS